ncbi:Transcriptional coactivator p100 [Phaffia rhodozyma]|uniref:Transcriptional coactivator p100 n=1 Tax=Phaffia rhodozyma TaxID=264483 RepID=A0A0F7SXJ9_PHARH|nr:Transcriptional coactivator p100 [Phaffia rhodozyma]
MSQPFKANETPKERILHLSGITAPRMGSSQREDEPYAFPSREFLRTLLVGKEVSILVLHSMDKSKSAEGSGVYSTDVIREYGTCTIPGATQGAPNRDVSSMVVSAGWATVRDSPANQDTAETARKDALRQLQAEAEANAIGLHAGLQRDQPLVNFHMRDSQAFLSEYKGQPLDGIVENVRDGSSLRIRLLLQGEHQFVNLNLAGIKAPRVNASAHGPSSTETGEPFSEESKFFVESRLLQRAIKVILLSSPVSIGGPSTGTTSAAPSTTPSPTSSGILPPPPPTTSSTFFGLAQHPAGDISQILVAAGLAKVLDWHAGLLSSFGGMDKLRAAEKAAQAKKLGVWENYVPTSGPAARAAAAAVNGSAGSKAADAHRESMLRTFDATVTRIWSADSVSVQEKGQTTELRVQLASTRGTRASDPKQAYWADQAKEFLRKKLIGKSVQVTIDYVKPKEGDFDEKPCATIRFGGAHAAVTELRGLHSQKEMALPRIIDASESGAKASQFLPFFKRAGRQAAVVEFVAAGSRFKVLLPKENKKLTFVLAGIRAPRTVRNPSEKGEPYGVESHRFASRYMQRDVEVEFETVDKVGGYIGAMYVNKTENVAVELVRAGLAQVHAYTAESLPFARQLFAAEEEAKRNKANLWSSYDPAVEEAAKALPTAYFDVIVSCVTADPFGFSVQILDGKNQFGAALEKLMAEFSSFHASPSARSPPGFSPKAGELISGQFSEDDQWYRARVKRASALKKECEVVFIDYGNEEVLPFSKVRPIDSKFKTLPPQAHAARLSFVKLVKPGTEYAEESIFRFRDIAEGRKLIANIDYEEPTSTNSKLLHLRLIDPADPATARDALASVNKDMIREGLGSLDTTTNLAKRERLGQFEFGDVSEE